MSRIYELKSCKDFNGDYSKYSAENYRKYILPPCITLHPRQSNSIVLYTHLYPYYYIPHHYNSKAQSLTWKSKGEKAILPSFCTPFWVCLIVTFFLISVDPTKAAPVGGTTPIAAGIGSVKY
jgi:hypothetical protein